MSKWSELERAAREADGAVARNINTATEKWQHFRLLAKPDAVLTLIEQNRELLEALQDAVDSMASMQREVDNLIDYAGGTGGYGEHNEDIKRILAIIRKATGEEA